MKTMDNKPNENWTTGEVKMLNEIFGGLTAQEFFKINGFMPIAGGALDGDGNGNGDVKDEGNETTDSDLEKELGIATKDREDDGEEDDGKEKDESEDGEEAEDDKGGSEENALDPKDDVDVKLPGGKVVKISEVLKWQKSHGQEGDFTKKSQKLQEGFKQLSALKEMSDYLKANPNKLKKVLAVMEEAEEAAQDVKDQGGNSGDVKDAIDEVLKKLDMSNPVNVLLKFLVDSNKNFAKKIEQTEKQEQQFLTQRKQEQHQEAVGKATQILNTTLTSELKTLEITDEEEKSLVRQMTLSFLKDNPKDYEGDDDFKETVKGLVKKYKTALDKHGEKKLASYLKRKKGSGVPVAGDGSDGTKTKQKESDINGDNLQQVIMDALDEQEAATAT